MKLECENYNAILHYTNQTTQWRINFNYITCHWQKPSNDTSRGSPMVWASGSSS